MKNELILNSIESILKLYATCLKTCKHNGIRAPWECPLLLVGDSVNACPLALILHRLQCGAGKLKFTSPSSNGFEVHTELVEK